MSEYIKKEDALEKLQVLWDEIHARCGWGIDPDCKIGIDESMRVVASVPTADVTEGVACKECRFRDVCQQEIKMLGPGIVYEYSLKIEGCSLGEKRR